MINPNLTFSKIADSTKLAIAEQFPINGKLRSLSIDDIEIPEPNFTMDDEYEAKYKNKTLSVPVYATLSLKDNDGKIIDHKKRHKMMDLPVYTNRGSFLVNGNEYTISTQNRKRPGVYPIMRQTGEVEGTINAAKGLMKKTTITLDSKTSQFKLQIGSSNLELLPILRSVGISDGDIRANWGDAVFDANANAISERVHKSAIKDAAQKLTGKGYDTVEEAGNALKAKFAEVVLDKEINKKTIGVESDRLDPSVFLGTTGKLLRINRGEDTPVDQSSMEYKDFLWVDDFIKERIKLEARKFRGKIAKLADNTDKINDAITSSILTKTVKGFFTDASLSELSDQHNPIDIHSSINKITSLGEGAIMDLRAVLPTTRALQQSSMGIMDPIQTPESEKIGLVLHMAAGTKKEGKKLLTSVYNTRTGQMEEIDHVTLAEKTVALPGKDMKAPEILAVRNGKMTLVKNEEVDYIIPRPQMMFSQAINMVPFLNSNNGGRVFMAAKQMGQAIPVITRDEPLIQTGIGNTSFEKTMGIRTALIAPISGTITKIEGNKLFIQDKVVPFYKDFPLNQDHVSDTDLLVKVGDTVQAGQLIGDSNFTKNGTLAIGQNMRVAYITDGGYNFEDGITVSESAAKKLSSVHLYKKDFTPGKDIHQFLDKYLLQFPTQINKQQIEKLDGFGVIKEGMEVNSGDPLVVAMRHASLDDENLTVSQISQKLQRPWRDATQYWDGEGKGTVTKVLRNEDGGVRVYVKAIEGGQIADKLAGRYGNKGVISRILSDEKMPTDKDGNPFDLLLSPLSIPSRMNPGQMYETALSKVAQKNGKPIIIESFKDDDILASVQKQLRDNGFNEDGTEEIFDADGTRLGNVLAGYQYILKLAKQAKTGFSARSAGAGESYDANKSPASGGDNGAKALDILSIYAMLAHGAKANLREMSTDKASNNPEFWNAVRNGAPLPAPKQTFAYEKFMSYLKGAGVNVERRGDYLQLLPFTDDDIIKTSNGAVTKAKFINAKDLKAKKGGFLDPRIFGKEGKNWGHIDLVEPIINPVFKHGLQSILGITEADMLKKSPKELVEIINNLDLDAIETGVQKQLTKTTSAQTEDKLNKRLRYIKALKESGIDPQKVYILTKYPVLPSNMRPIIGGEETDQIVSEINFLYRDLVLSNDAVKNIKAIPYMPQYLKAEMQHNLQSAADAVAGVTDPIGNYDKRRIPAGFIEQIKGRDDVPSKMGFFQRKVIRKTLDVTGRGVLTPDPQLGLDEVGIPEDMAWSIYRPFIEARMRRTLGLQHADILKNIDEKSPLALQTLKNEMNERPVIMNRAPSLHKFSMLAFRPFLSNGKTIRIPSLVVKGFNADFDGDTMIVHVPTRPEAVAEAYEKLMAKNNLFSNRAGNLIHVPPSEAMLGIYKATKTSTGLKMLNDIVPDEYRELVKPNMGGKEINALITAIAENSPEQYVDLSKKLSIFGNEVAFKSGSTINLNDLKLNDPELEQMKKKAYSEYYRFRDNPRLINEVLLKYNGLIKDRMMTHNNNLTDLIHSGAKSQSGQIKQMIASPVQYTNADKSPIPLPIMSNYANGMNINDYWISQFSSRRGMIDRKMETEEPGAFAKQVLISVTDKLIGDNKELTDEGEEFDVKSYDAFGRYLAKDVIIDGKKIAEKGDVLTPKKAAALASKGVKTVNIHTVLSSNTGSFVDPKSWGLSREGKLLDTGSNIGALAGQAIAEPLQQGIMRTFHTGGVIGGGGDLVGFDKVQKLLTLPIHVPNQATVSNVAGKITDIQINPAGGFNIMIGDNKMFVRPGIKVIVKPGDDVKNGDILSEGFVHPSDILETKGVDYTRKFMTQELASSFAAMGVKVDRRNLEVIVKSLTDSAKVIDPGDSDHIRGDIVNYDEIKLYNSQPAIAYDKGNDDLIGKILSEETNGYPAGTVVTVAMINNLPKQVMAKNDPIKIRPILLGIKNKPLKASDWITNLAYGYIQRGLEQRAPAMEKAPIHGTAPLPAFAFGSEFGKGKWY